MNELLFSNTGSYKVLTSTGSMYVVVLNGGKAGTILRLPDPENSRSVDMRKDSDAAILIAMYHCHVDSHAVFLMSGITEDPTFITQRITTPVVEITQLN